MNKKKKLLIILGVAAALIILYFVFFKNAISGGGTLSDATLNTQGISQAYASDTDNVAKINSWIAGEPNASVQLRMKAWLATTDANQRAFLANYYDFLKSGNNASVLLPRTMSVMQSIDAAKSATGFHL